MDHSLIAESSIEINAAASKVWQVLTKTELIKQFLYGTETSTDWQVGSPIAFKGSYNEQTYHDKGQVLKHVKHESLQYSYWSSFSGLEDKAENYAKVSYRLDGLGENNCKFTWHQQGFKSEEGKCHTEEGLKGMLQKIKELAESL